MTISSLPLIRWRLAQLAVHLVVALIALVVVGGATRVMEAGLACPDWPLCFGSFLPGRQMNLQVFLEWFHRLDAFLIGIALLIQLSLSIIWKNKLPNWHLFSSLFLVFLVCIQGGLGALTVMNLLQSGVVTAHLAIGLILVASMSGLSQRLLSTSSLISPLWWRTLSGASLFAVVAQSLLGARMATSWAAQSCLNSKQSCDLLYLHRNSAIPVAGLILIFAVSGLLVKGWPRSQWPFLFGISFLVFLQMSLGFMTLSFGLSQPLITVSHQLIASLLVALLSALAFRRPEIDSSLVAEKVVKTSLEPCHG